MAAGGLADGWFKRGVERLLDHLVVSPAIVEVADRPLSQFDQGYANNGPVIANHLIMRRTAGSDPGAASGAPAEAFNLRPDAYIWATNYNQNSGRLSTVATQELPPRF